jgi:hypothetical protein
MTVYLAQWKSDSDTSLLSYFSGEPCAIGQIRILQCPGEATSHFAVTFSVFFFQTCPDLRKAAPLAPMSGSHSPMRLKSFEPKSPLRLRRPAILFISTLALTWKPSCQPFANAFMSLVLLISFSQPTKGEVAGLFFVTMKHLFLFYFVISFP